MTHTEIPQARLEEIRDGTRSLKLAAKALVEAVQRDDTGMLVGKEFQGGNGGLLSRETLIVADRLRKSILADDSDLDAIITELLDRRARSSLIDVAVEFAHDDEIEERLQERRDMADGQ